MIGYYVHHQGAGHHSRMKCIAAHVTTPMTVLSSLPPAAGFEDRWVTLPSDELSGVPADADVTAHGTSHWVPLGHDGLRDRMAAIAQWVHEAVPTLVVVDVSCEVARLVRLMGVPVIVVGMRGNRTDRAHVDTYDLAEALLVPWAREFHEPTWSEHWLAKTWHVGAFSNADGRARREQRLTRSAVTQRRRVVLLSGAGGSDVTREQVDQARSATPDWDWDVVGVPGYPWQADPWPMLRAADVVVTHAGQNAIAEVAAARLSAIVLPQARPHGEQDATAAALDRAGLARVIDAWPQQDDWAALLESAARTDPSGWAVWAPGDGAMRAAAHIDEAAGSHRP